jgi:hypothetical protein
VQMALFARNINFLVFGMGRIPQTKSWSRRKSREVKEPFPSSFFGHGKTNVESLARKKSREDAISFFLFRSQETTNKKQQRISFCTNIARSTCNLRRH